MRFWGYSEWRVADAGGIVEVTNHVKMYCRCSFLRDTRV